MDIDDLIIDKCVAPKPGQVYTKPTGKAGWSKPSIGSSDDLTRILSIDRKEAYTKAKTQALILYMTQKFSVTNNNCKCSSLRPGDSCITQLRASQAVALYEMRRNNGLIGSIGVGHGKTIIGLLSPLSIKRCKTALLLLPPTLVDQLIREYEVLSQHFRVPSLIVHGKDYSKLVKHAPALHVMPYSRLCRASATTFISRLKPDLIISDEVHKLKDRNTATTSRVINYFEENPNTRFCGWTGTLSDKSIKDYAHLSDLALRSRSPLPRDEIVLDEWATAIDPSDFPAPPGELFKLCKPGETIQQGFSRRLSDTEGFVLTKESAIDAKILIKERKIKTPKIIKEYINALKETWTRPDGEEFTEMTEVIMSAKQLACGFYYRWVYPNGEPESLIDSWFEARKAWNKELRYKLQNRQEYLDSPLLCAQAAQRYLDNDKSGLPVWKSEHWARWRDIKDKVKPETQAVRLHPFLAEDATDWALKNLGIVWYSYKCIGEWIGELSGLTVHTGGPKSGDSISKEDGSKSIIASIGSHGTGRDGLQRLFKDQLIVNPPSSSKMWEQMLGRLHRIGQKSDIVEAKVYRHTQDLRESVDTALKRALYVQDTLKADQKLKAGFNLE